MEILLVPAAATVLIWAGAFLRFAGLWGYCIATLLAGTVVGYPFLHAGAITVDRLLLVACLGLHGLYRYWRLGQPKPWGRSDTLLVALIGVLAVSTLTHDWKIESTAPLSKLIFYFVLPACMYWLARELELTPQKVRWLFWSFAALGFYLAVTAIAEKFEIRWAVFPKFINDPKNLEFLGRGRGPLLNPSGNGILLTLGLSCALMFFPWVGKFWKICVVASVPIYLLGIYCTLTRCVWIGGVLALFGIILVSIPAQFRLPLLLVGTLSGGAVVALNFEKFTSFKRDKNVSSADMKESAQLRPILAVIAWKVFKDHPVLGCGMGQYRQVAKYHLTDRNIDMPLEKVRPYVQHNIFLALLTEAGLVGAALFTAIMAIWTRWAWKIWRCRDLVLEYRQLGLVFLGFLAGYLANGMFQDVLIIPMVNMYYFFLGGCIRNLACHPQLEVSTRFAPIPARLSPSAAETFSPTVAPGGV
jgi:hypothetical protein